MERKFISELWEEFQVEIPEAKTGFTNEPNVFNPTIPAWENFEVPGLLPTANCHYQLTAAELILLREMISVGKVSEAQAYADAKQIDRPTLVIRPPKYNLNIK